MSQASLLDVRPVDRELLDVLRQQPRATVAQLTAELGVTATAIRQRLERMLEAGFVERQKVVAGRGRPTFAYALTPRGRREAGADYGDLAEALWMEVMALPDGRLRRNLLRRVAQRLGQQYRAELDAGGSFADRLQSLSALLGARRIPADTHQSRGLPVLDVHACPYPDLTDEGQRRAMCHLEEDMLSEALGRPVHLAQCRLDGDATCQFAANE